MDLMPEPPANTCSAFAGSRRIASGALGEVALAVRDALASGAGPILTFDDGTGKVIDLDTRGSREEVLARLGCPGSGAPAEPPRGRGRPKLGVVPREVTLLPRHWTWLNAQPGGASVALRKLVEAARQAGEGSQRRRSAQEAAYRFMSAMAGDAPGFEEALRALFSAHLEAFATHIQGWPEDVREHALRLARPAFAGEIASAGPQPAAGKECHGTDL